MIVIDASIVIDALALPVSPELKAKWDALDGEEVAAPHLIDLEVLHALRRHVRRRAVAPARAQATLEALQALPLIRYPHVDLLASI